MKDWFRHAWFSALPACNYVNAFNGEDIFIYGVRLFVFISQAITLPKRLLTDLRHLPSVPIILDSSPEKQDRWRTVSPSGELLNQRWDAGALSGVGTRP